MKRACQDKILEKFKGHGQNRSIFHFTAGTYGVKRIAASVAGKVRESQHGPLPG
jgi:hypothetical protein